MSKHIKTWQDRQKERFAQDVRLTQRSWANNEQFMAEEITDLRSEVTQQRKEIADLRAAAELEATAPSKRSEQPSAAQAAGVDVEREQAMIDAYLDAPCVEGSKVTRRAMIFKAGRIEYFKRGWMERAKLAITPSEGVAQHPDDLAIDRTAAAMKAEMARQRAKGRGGWDDPTQCTVERLAALLIDAVQKGDPVHIANYAMMIHQRGGTAIDVYEAFAVWINNDRKKAIAPEIGGDSSHATTPSEGVAAPVEQINDKEPK